MKRPIAFPSEANSQWPGVLYFLVTVPSVLSAQSRFISNGRIFLGLAKMRVFSFIGRASRGVRDYPGYSKLLIICGLRF